MNKGVNKVGKRREHVNKVENLSLFTFTGMFTGMFTAETARNQRFLISVNNVNKLCIE